MNNKVNFEIKKLNNEETESVSKKEKRGNLIYSLILFLILIISIGYSFYSKGFKYTIERILMLIVYALLGFCLFWLIYLIFILVDMIVTKIKNSRAFKITEITDEVNNFIETNKFQYSTKISLKENLFAIKNIIMSGTELVFKSSKKESKYILFDYSIGDAISVGKRVVSDIYLKIDVVFSFLKLNNKPLGFVENFLAKKLSDSEPEEIPVKKQNNFLTKIKDTILKNSINVGATIFKNPINNLVNDLIKYIIVTSFDLANGNMSVEVNDGSIS